jgi:hypothetical protein
MKAPLISDKIDIFSLGIHYYNRKNSWYIANVPLELIEFINWDKFRYNHNKELISEFGTVKPIILGDFDKELGKYSLTDGNHRCFCCNELGYTHIPAIISKKTKDIRFYKL